MRRPPVVTGASPACPIAIIPVHVSAGVVDAARGRGHRIDGSQVREGDRFVFFASMHLRAMPWLHRPSHADALLVHAGLGITDSVRERVERGSFGDGSAGDYL